ncbi:MAG TPA: hypothetical protein PLA54_14640, partial [Spirochaetota bacterium]|nr:hypothetical protein [Spirochaetota bacterium]
QKKPAKEKDVAQSPRGFFSLRFSHRLQRIAKAQLIMYSASPNGLGVCALMRFLPKHENNEM